MKNNDAKQLEKKEQAMPVNNTVILEHLPPKVKKVLEKSKYTYSENEQILLTLLAQIIVEIILKEEI